jgi:hypothetical protein
MGGFDCKKFYHILILTFVATLVVIFIANLLFGFGTSFVYDKRFYRGIGTKRYSFGFCNPNRFQVEMFALMVFLLWLWSGRLNIWIRILFGVLYFGTCIFTDSYTGLLVGSFVYMIFFILEYVKWENWKNILMVCVVFCLILMMLISLVGATGFRGVIIDNIDSFISERIGQLSEYNNEEIHLTGEIYNWRLFASRLHKNVYDLGYVQLFYYYGIVPAVCYLAFVFYAIYVAWKENNVLGILALWGFSIYLFMESAYFSNYLQRDFLLMTAAYIVTVKGTGYEKKVASMDI